MKIKNIAFFGVMAAILSVGSAARADSTTVIASQAYVDAKDALKQNLLNSGTNGNVVVSGTGNVVTGITADGQGTVTVTKGNVDVTAAVHDGIRDGITTTAPSENAVYDAIAAMDSTQRETDVATDTAVTAVEEADGAVTVTSGQLTGNAVTYNDETEYDEGTIGKKVKEIASTVSSIDQVNDSITDGNTNTAPSENAVYDAIHVASNGNYIVAGNAVNTNLGNLDTQVKTNEDDISTINTTISNMDTTYSQSDVSTGTVIKNVTESNGVIEVTRGSIADADVASNAAIAKSKINFSQAELDALGSGITSSLVTQIGTNRSDISDINSLIEQTISAEDGGVDIYNQWVEAGRKQSGNEWTALLNIINNSDVDNVVNDWQKSHQEKIPRNRNIQKGIAYLKGTGIENYTANVDNTDTEGTGIKNRTVKEAAQTAWTAELDKTADDYVPTVAAVERRVQAAEASATSGITSATDNTASASTAQNATTLTIVAAGNDGNQTTKLATSHAVAEGFTAVNTAIGNMALTGATADTTNTYDDAVTVVSQSNGKLAATKGKLTATALASDAKATTIRAVGTAVDTKLATEAAVANAIDSVNTDVSGKANKATNLTASSANSIVQYNNEGIVISGTAAGALATKDTITYSSDTDFKLSNVDVTGQADTAYTKCTKNSPCTLTFMYDSGRPIYEWTNMDTENTDALL